MVMSQENTCKEAPFTSEECLDEELFCAWHYCYFLEKGPPENFFDTNEEDETKAGVPAENAATKQTDQLNLAVFFTSDYA